MIDRKFDLYLRDFVSREKGDKNVRARRKKFYKVGEKVRNNEVRDKLLQERERNYDQAHWREMISSGSRTQTRV